LKKKKLLQRNELCFARREIEILREVVEHPNIVKIFEFFDNKDEICICMELLTGGDVLDRLKCIQRPFTANETKKHLQGIFNAINYLHENMVAHRDLKPENLIFESNSDEATLKIIDFGFAKSLRRHGALSSPCGSVGYSSKELVDNASHKRKYYTIAVDMFALGCVAYCMLYANPPFLSDDPDENCREAEIDRKVKLGIYEFPDTIPIPNKARDFVERLLATNPEDRMTASQALKHSWMVEDTSEEETPQHLTGRTSLTEDRSATWVRHNTHRPIETFRTAEKIREREKREKEQVGVGEWWRESWWSEVDSVRVLDPLEPEPERGKKEKYKEKKWVTRLLYHQKGYSN